MAKVLDSYNFKKPTKASKAKVKAPPPRMKVVHRILDSWGGKVIQQFAYKDLATAEQRLEQLKKEGHSAYYLQSCKVPF